MANESGLLGEEVPDWLMDWLTGRISPTVPSVNTSVEKQGRTFFSLHWKKKTIFK